MENNNLINNILKDNNLTQILNAISLHLQNDCTILHMNNNHGVKNDTRN